MYQRVSLILAGFLVACATPQPPAPKQPWPGTESRPSAPVSKDEGASDAAPVVSRRDVTEEIARVLDRDPKAWATRYPKSAQCEAAARELRRAGGTRGWRALRACVERGQFKLFNKITDGFWDEDLRTQADAPIVLANVIATRGADLLNDVEVLQRRRIPLFTLTMAKAHPEIYRGRSVIFSAAVDDVKTTKGGAVTARLALIQRVGKSRMVVERGGYGSVQKSKYSGDPDDSYSVQYDNVSEETDETVLARLSRVDPFFAPGRSFVVVGRFDGFTTPTSTPDEPEPEPMPLTTVFAYFEPGAEALE
jgi:hypothetical protein